MATPTTKATIGSMSLDEVLFPSYPSSPSFTNPNIRLERAKYATSVDERGYISVYEYSLRDQTIMWDYHSGYVHLTGIWKALGNSKADILRLIDTHPELDGVIRRIRGGYLKVQGTWMPFDLAQKVALRTCFAIRYELTPIFGAAFPDACLTPDMPGFGALDFGNGVPPPRRRKRRTTTTGVDGAPPSDYVPIIARRNSSPRHASPYAKSPPVFPSSLSSSSHSSISSLASSAPPPPLPAKVTLSQNEAAAEEVSSVDLVQLLTAARCLQLLSLDAQHQQLPWNLSDQGGSFSCGDKQWKWDGLESLSLIGSTTTPATTKEEAMDPDEKPAAVPLPNRLMTAGIEIVN